MRRCSVCAPPAHAAPPRPHLAAASTSTLSQRTEGGGKTGGREIERFLMGRGDVRGGGDGGEKSTYAPINGMVSGKYLWKNARTCSPVVILSNSSKGMKSVQVNVLS